MVSLKFASVAIPLVICRYPVRVALVSGLTLAQIGEFSFLLGNRGQGMGLLSAEDGQTFLAAAVVTMAITPLLIAAAPRLASWVPLRGDSSGLSADDKARSPNSNSINT